MGIYELQEREATSMKAMHERAAAHVKTLGGGGVTIIRPQY